MHFEILVEDQSGKKALEILVPKIVGMENSFRVIPYKGIGRTPKNLKSSSDAKKRILLDQLPRLLQGYGNAYVNCLDTVAIFVICDLDTKCLKEFRQELFSVLDSCKPKPVTRFCLAIEEGEAWLLGDKDAIKEAYPRAKTAVLRRYVYDSICGTWELLADAVSSGGSQALKKKGYQAIGKAKSEWAEMISPLIDIGKNQSPSFNYLKGKLLELSEK